MEFLTDKKYRQYAKMSRYSAFPYYFHSGDKKFTYGTDAWLSDKTIYTNHTVAQGDTFDSLALYYYNNPTLYWIICSFNHITDPFQKLTVGSLIKIPSISNIEFDLE